MSDDPFLLDLVLDHDDIATFAREFGPNLSADGVFIPTSRSWPLETELSFRILLRDEEPILFGLAQVTRVIVGKGVDLRFLALDGHSQSLLDDILQRLSNHSATHQPTTFLAGPSETIEEARKRIAEVLRDTDISTADIARLRAHAKSQSLAEMPTIDRRSIER